MATTDADTALILGAMEETKSRELPDGSLIEFEFAPAGYLKRDGEIRRADHRAYYYTPAERSCGPCSGDGRVFDRSDRGRKCPGCEGSGNASRRTRLPSVTTLVNRVCPKDGLQYWYEERGILGVIEAIRRGELDPHDESIDPVDVVRALKLGGDAARDEAATRGLDVHDCLEVWMRTGRPPNPASRPAAHHGYLRGLTRFLLRYRPRRAGAIVEELVCSPTRGYAGREDLVAFLDDGLWTAIDAKTQKDGCIFLGAHLQLNLYERARVENGGVPADRKLVVVFAEDGTYEVELSDHPDSFVVAALGWAAESRPVDSQCESRNKRAREVRKAVMA